MTPFFSIIVPVYNVEDYVKRCVLSLIQQSFTDIEILLVDDGATDNSGKICDEFESNDIRIKTFHKKNGGLASARNYGLKHAKGKYVSFVDSDDYIELDTYKILYKNIMNNQADVIGFGYNKVQNHRIIKEIISGIPEGLYMADELKNYIIPEMISKEVLFTHSKHPIIKSACMHVYNRNLIEKYDVKFEDEKKILNEDYLFIFTVLLYAKSIQVLHLQFYNYDTRIGSLSLTYKKNMLKTKKALYYRYVELLDELKIIEFYKSRLCNLYIDGVYACILNECYGLDKNTIRQRISNIHNILHDKELRKCLNECDISKFELKGKIIICLMKVKFSGLMYLGYKLMNKNSF